MTFAGIFGKDCCRDRSIHARIKLHALGFNGNTFYMNNGFIGRDNEQAGDLGVAANGAKIGCASGFKVHGAKIALGYVAHRPVHSICIVVICHALRKLNHHACGTNDSAGPILLIDSIQTSVHRNTVKLAFTVCGEGDNSCRNLSNLVYGIIIQIYGHEIACFNAAVALSRLPRLGIGYGIELAGGVVKGHIAPAVISGAVVKEQLTAPIGYIYLVEPSVFGEPIDIAAHVCACGHIGIIIKCVLLNMLICHIRGVIIQNGDPAK